MSDLNIQSQENDPNENETIRKPNPLNKLKLKFQELQSNKTI